MLVPGRAGAPVPGASRRDPRRACRAAVEITRTGRLDFLDETRAVREDAAWRVAQAPADLQDRRVEITGPTDAKMLINALNSGARVFMADFEDSNTPTWSNLVQGQRNLSDAIDRVLEFTSPEGKHYELVEHPAVLLVRPRGWHLVEKHVLVDGQPMSGSLFDFGLYLFRNAPRLAARGTGPYFYLPKLEGHREARLWNEVFVAAEELLGLPVGTVRVTVLIETITAAFEMEEILYELRDHIVGLNAGRWDYIFSVIKKFRDCGPAFVLPDRRSVTMTSPFMRAYTEQLVATCHRRGAFAIGGMAAFIPSRRDAEVNEIAMANVRADKQREATDGFDGTWVAHPDLVPVASEAFDQVLGDRSNQLERQRDDVVVTPEQLLDVASTEGTITRDGLRNNLTVALQYLASWLAGTGAVAIFNLMEDVATAEISRSQVWQWVHQGVRLEDGEVVTADLVRALADAEHSALEADAGNDVRRRHLKQARALLEEVALADHFIEFLTLAAYPLID